MSEIEKSTYEGILKAARDVFMEKDYRHAGLREIAARAGVTTGAFYGYFRNKAELFDALVGDCYRELLDIYRRLLSDFATLPAEQQIREMHAHSYLGMVSMTNYVYDHYTEFKLILCHAEGTPYSNLVHEIAELDVEATHQFAKTTKDAGTPVRTINPMLEHMLMSGMFSMFFEMIIHDIPRDDAIVYLGDLLEFYTGGWMRIMGL